MSDADHTVQGFGIILMMVGACILAFVFFSWKGFAAALILLGISLIALARAQPKSKKRSPTNDQG